MSNTETLILPAGVAVWPHLNEVDVYRPKGGAEKRQYITHVRYEPKVLKEVQAMIVEWGKANGAKKGTKLPFREMEKDGTKEYLLKAASGEKYRPPLFDAKNKKLPSGLIVGGGSIIRLKVKPSVYEGFGGGVNLYINQVQVLKFVADDGGASSFDEADGWSYEGGDEETGGFDATGGEDSTDDALTL